MKKGLLVGLAIVFASLILMAQESEGLKIGETTWKFNGEIRFMYTDQTDPMYYSSTMYVRDSDVYELDSFNRMYQRYRFGVIGELNDRLLAHFELQVGDEQWGNKNYNEREVNIRTRLAYLQFKPEFLGDNTAFRIGLQGYDDIFQYSVWSDEGVGIMLNHTTDTFTANLGYLTLRDDDVDTELLYFKSRKPLPIDIGVVPMPASETLFIADMTLKANEAMSIKGAFYYDYIRDYDMSFMGPEDMYMTYKMAFYGAGVDYAINDMLSFGGHFVLRNGSLTITDEEDDETNEIDINGWFAYAYSTVTMDKFSAKVNFGYTPFELSEESMSVTAWGGAFFLLDGGSEMGIFGGNQWQTAYGLEYYGRGDVCDRQAVNSGYGGWSGLMVISANLSYDFLFANFGILRATDSTDYGTVELKKDIGTEIDLGIKTEIMKGLEFKAVYAMFFTGDYYTYGDVKLDNAHEMSMQLRYAF